jgi:hypothetical protein
MRTLAIVVATVAKALFAQGILVEIDVFPEIITEGVFDGPELARSGEVTELMKRLEKLVREAAE